jgi:hypothetical protein
LADNTQLSAAVGSGDVLASDDIGGVKYPRGKIVIGADGTNDGDVSASNPLPVKGTGTAGTANAGVLTVQGIASMTPVQVADNGGSLTVDGTVAATQSGTWNVGTVTAVSQNGDVRQSTASNLNAEVQGDAAHDASVSGNPVLVGGYASASAPADVSADGDAVRLWADRAGRLQVGDGGSSLTVDGTVAATQSGTWNVGTVTSITNAVTVSGTVTANAGTNLNTSALALESGGNLAAAAASLSVVDDWDESDRAKVNPIVGQAGVAAGAGAVGATTQRVTLASDDPAVAALQLLDNAVSGNELQVDVVAALPAGANNIGDVDVASVAGAADSGNSTTSTLSGGAAFTGSWFDLLNYETTTVIVKADVASAADGLEFHWSPDGSNADVTSASGLAAGEGRGFHLAKRGRYFRVKYTNGGSAQGAFRLNVHHNPAGTGTITRPLDSSIDDDNYGQIVRSVLAAKKTSDGTYTNIQCNANGRLIVTNENVLTDDAAFTPGSSAVGMIGATFDDAAPDSVNEGDGGALRMSANRNLYTTLRDAAGNERGANVNASNELLVALSSVPSHAVTNAGTFAVQESGAALTALQLIDDPVATDGSAASAKLMQVGGTDGTNAQTLSTNASGHLNVADGGNVLSVDDAGGSLTVDGTVAATQSGTWNVGTVTTVTAVSQNADVRQSTASNLNAQVVGNVAHDAADAGNAVKAGAKATSALSGLTLVANADRTDLFAGLDGVLITRPHCNLEDIVSGNASNTDGSSTQVIAAAGAGVKQYLTSVVLTNTSSSSIYVEMKSGTTVKATIPVPANGGAVFNPAVPLPPNAANEAWNFDPSAATTTVFCTAVGFKSKV